RHKTGHRLHRTGCRLHRTGCRLGHRPGWMGSPTTPFVSSILPAGFNEGSCILSR
ncbi:hypothetical protein IRJ41_025906, partial [Triplophysa rosa]